MVLIDILDDQALFYQDLWLKYISFSFDQSIQLPFKGILYIIQILNGKNMSFFKHKDSLLSQDGLQTLSKDSIEVFFEQSDETVKKQRKPHRKSENRRSYHWNDSQQKKYINFLVQFQAIFQSSATARRLAGIHLKMAQIIRSRSSKQCKSHHQKMLKKHGSTEVILKEFKNLIQEVNTPTETEEVVVKLNTQKADKISDLNQEEFHNASRLTPSRDSRWEMVIVNSEIEIPHQESWSLLLDFSG